MALADEDGWPDVLPDARRWLVGDDERIDLTLLKVMQGDIKQIEFKCLV